MPVRFVLVCAVILLSQSALWAAVPPELEGCKVLRVWDFARDDGGWKPDHNVGPFKIKDGILSFENIGPDPWIVNRSVVYNTSDYKFVGIKMRASKPGSTQVLFGTQQSGGPAAGMSTQHLDTRGPQFRFYEFDMSLAPLWSGTVNILRIDPVNGGSEVGARVEIDWIAVYQLVRPTIRVGRPYAYSDKQGVTVSIPISNVGGPKVGDRIRITAGGTVRDVDCPNERATDSVTLRISQPDRRIPVEVAFDDKTIFSGSLAAPTGNRLRRSASVNLKTIAFQQRGLLSEASLQWPDGSTAGVFRPLGALAYLDKNGVPHYIEPMPKVDRHAEDSVVLRARENVDGGSAAFTWTLTKESICCEMTSTTPIQVLRFEGPRLLAGEGSFGRDKTGGLFPGLEYLDRNEPSSAERHIGARFADRHIPDPYEITVPLMAIESEKGVVGISWDPLQEWASGSRLPCAEFESPNRSEGAANHLMTLFAPGIPDYVAEDTDFATTPYVLEPGKSIKITQQFFAMPGGKIVNVVPDYYRVHGVPKPPPIAHGADGTIDVCMKAYAEILYNAELNGWKNHIGLHQTPGSNPAFATTVLAESIRRGDPELARKIKIEPGAQLSAYIGSTLEWFSEAENKRIEGLISLLRPDGSYPYQSTQDIISKVAEVAPNVGPDQKALGDNGENNSGLTMRALLPILDAAARTGNKRAIEAGALGLRYLNSCAVPRGMQTWEVHAHAPDILASAHALQANLLGYEITGEPKYLDYARYWAYTGLPFVYGWTPPIEPVPASVLHFDEGGEGKGLTSSKPSEFYRDTRRFVNPGASIAVFGTTFYVGSWFGKPVQWCGMVWANMVRRYLKCRADPLLMTMADAVFASCTQQQFDKGWAAGTYPDSVSLRENTVNCVFIQPDTILDYAYSLKGEKRPSIVSSRGFDLNGNRCVLNTYAVIEGWEVTNRRLDATLKYYPDQDLYTAISSTPRPASIELDGDLLGEVVDLKTVSGGYQYDQANRVLHVKCRPRSRMAALGVVW